MDATKKRKIDENGVESTETDAAVSILSSEDARKIIEKFGHEQLLDILQNAVVRHVDVLDSVRLIADHDIAQRKLFIRGLGWETTTENLRSLFSVYGELEEAIVILDKVTGKSKGYGFVTFKHVDGALLALKESSKKIDGRVTVTQLAAAGNTGPSMNWADVSMRKIFVGNVPFDMPADKLLAHFLQYGEIEEGPLGFDKQTGKSKGFALFVYKSPEGAQAAVVEQLKIIEGRQLNCKLAIDGKRKPGAPAAGPGEGHGDGMGMAPPSSIPGSIGGQYGGPGGPGGLGSYSGYSGGFQGPPPMGHHHPNSSLPSSLGGQQQSSLGGIGGYGGGLGSYGGPGLAGYGGLGNTGGGALGGAGGFIGLGGVGGGSSLYRLPPGSSGMPSSGYPESGQYNLSSSSGYPSQHQQLGSGTSPLPRVTPGGMYPNVPPYYSGV